MSKRKQKPILSDKIAELIAPRRLLDPEIDSEDETTARAVDYEIDEDFDEVEPVSKLSDIRKKNVKLLHDIDEKYRGKVSSRKELDLDSDSNESDDCDDLEQQSDSHEQEEEEEEEAEDEEVGDKSIGEFSMMLTPRQRIKLAQDDGSAEENEIENADSSEDDDDDDDDENLKSFTNKLKKPETKANKIDEESDSDDDLNVNGNAELEKWDDDYEGEEIEEEEDSGEEENGSGNEPDDGDEEEFGSDEDESDFDGGDIISKTPIETPEKQDFSRILPKQQKEDHLSKGVCVQNQLQIWEKLLEVRIHSQKMLTKANSLPQPSKFEKLAQNAEFSELANDTADHVSRLVSQMRDLQSLLLNQYTETKQIAAKRKPITIDAIRDPDAKRSRLSDELEKDFSNFKEYQYSVISKWHDRTKVLTPGSIKTQKQQGNIDVLRKIEGVLANREELIKKSQLLKGGYELFDKSTAIVEPKQIKQPGEDDNGTTAENGGNENENTYSHEVYDDADFYHSQLRELIEYKTSSSSNANEMAKQFSELQKLRKKMKKTVDTRASKGRKIRYVVHNKLVSFTAPNNPRKWSDEQKDELFKSLFGAQN